MNTRLSMHPSRQQRLYGYLSLARISNSPTIISDSLVGAACAGVIWPDGTVAIVALAMLLFYIAGVYLNDVLDFAVDCHENPQRPLPAGLLSRTAATTITVSLFFIGSTLLSSIGLLPFLSGLVLIAFILCHNLWHRGNPLSPLFLAGCRGMVYVTAFLACSSRDLISVLIPVSLLMLYVIGLTNLAKARHQPRAINVGIKLILFLTAAYAIWRAPFAALPLVLFFTVWVTYSAFFIPRMKNRDVSSYRAKKHASERMVERLIAGIALLDALMLVTVGSAAGVAVALVAFGLTLFLQRYVRGSR
ncbi:MAG TPA: UbiA family prenyltransferase [Ktedonobacteraceae bacterium]|nr:UbiA family prenyltransferase [Ktedonobacteraceae bacterium]